MSHYDTLVVGDDADQDEIKKAYRNQAKKLHPDVGGDADEFRALIVAYETLSDKEKREHYDRTGENKAKSPATDAERIAISSFAEVLEDRMMDDSIRGEMIQHVVDTIHLNSDFKKAIRAKPKAESALRQGESILKSLLKNNDEGASRDLIQSTIEARLKECRSEIRQINKVISDHENAIDIVKELTIPMELRLKSQSGYTSMTRPGSMLGGVCQ